MTFYLHTRNSSEEIKITDNNFHSINSSKTFHFIIHGWIGDHRLEWVQSMTKAYLEQTDCNVIQVDWLEPAAQPHYVSAKNTQGVGCFELISSLALC